MNPDFAVPASHQDELAKELLSRLAPTYSGLGIRDLSNKLHMSRKATLRLLITLESQGVLVWEYTSRVYRPAPYQSFGPGHR